MKPFAFVLIAIGISLIVNILSFLSFENYGLMASVVDRQEIVALSTDLESLGVRQTKSMSESSLVVAMDLRSGLSERGVSGYYGYLIDLLERAKSTHEIELQFVALPGLRSLLEMRRGREMATLVFGHGSEGITRNQVPLISLPLSLYFGPNVSVFYDGLESLDELKIGILDGDHYESPLEEFLYGRVEGIFRAKGENGLEQLLDALILGRIDCMLVNSSVFEKSSADLGVDLEMFTRVDDKSLGNWNVYIGYSDTGEPELASRFSIVVDNWLLSESGGQEVERLQERHGLN